MTSDPKAVGRAQLEALFEAGAERGAEALAGLLGWHAEPFAWQPDADEAFHVGVFFELEGDVSGSMSLIFDRETSTALVDTLAPGLTGPAAESMLCEVANIVVSQVVSAVADVMGGRVTLSVPKPEGPVEVADRMAARDFMAMRLLTPGHPSGLLIGFEPAAPDARF